MPHAWAIKGAAAELRWGYHRAAALGAWSVTGAPGDWTLTATIFDVDDYRVSQRPLYVVTPNGWTWPVNTLQIADGTLTASIRPLGESHEPVPIRSA